MGLIRWMRRHVLWTVAAVVALATSAVAVAQQAGNGPRTDRVAATFELTRTKVQSRTCQGTDGLHAEQHATYEGTSAGDPRLTGRMTVRLESLVNPADADDGGRFQGTAEGHFRIQGPNGTLTTGNFIATLAGDGGANPVVRIEGTTDGQVRGPAHEVGGKLIGSLSGTSDRTGQQVVGQFGGSDDDQEQPAYIQSVSCTGPTQSGP